MSEIKTFLLILPFLPPSFFLLTRISSRKEERKEKKLAEVEGKFIFTQKFFTHFTCDMKIILVENFINLRVRVTHGTTKSINVDMSLSRILRGELRMSGGGGDKHARLFLGNHFCANEALKGYDLVAILARKALGRGVRVNNPNLLH
jgi:hypothetical protein